MFVTAMAKRGEILAWFVGYGSLALGLILTGAAIRFFIVYELSPEVRAEAVGQVTRWIEEGKLQHTVAAGYSLDRIVDAHRAAAGARRPRSKARANRRRQPRRAR